MRLDDLDDELVVGVVLPLQLGHLDLQDAEQLLDVLMVDGETRLQDRQPLLELVRVDLLQGLHVHQVKADLHVLVALAAYCVA